MRALRSQLCERIGWTTSSRRRAPLSGSSRAGTAAHSHSMRQQQWPMDFVTASPSLRPLVCVRRSLSRQVRLQETSDHNNNNNNEHKTPERARSAPAHKAPERPETDAVGALSETSPSELELGGRAGRATRRRVVTAPVRGVCGAVSVTERVFVARWPAREPAPDLAAPW